MGVLKPELIMKSLIPVVMAGILGIYGMIVAVILIQKSFEKNKTKQKKKKKQKQKQKKNHMKIINIEKYSNQKIQSNQTTKEMSLKLNSKFLNKNIKKTLFLIKIFS